MELGPQPQLAFSVVFRGPLAPWLPGLSLGFRAGLGAGPASSLLRTIGTIRGAIRRQLNIQKLKTVIYDQLRAMISYESE